MESHFWVALFPLGGRSHTVTLVGLATQIQLELSPRSPDATGMHGVVRLSIWWVCTVCKCPGEGLVVSGTGSTGQAELVHSGVMVAGDCWGSPSWWDGGAGPRYLDQNRAGNNQYMLFARVLDLY